MKKILISFVLASALLTTSTYASNEDDSCSVVLCMAGLLQGHSGGSECSDEEDSYFKIKVFKKGSFKKSDTAKKRAKLLDKCKSADSKWKSDINKAFGKLKSNPFR